MAKQSLTAAGRLTCIALTLPGIMQNAEAGRVEETYNADFLYGHYSESNRRMTADVFNGALAAPIGKSMTASVNLVRDTLSGASPMFNLKDADGKPRQILSGASIREQRDAVGGNLTYFWDKAALSVGGGFSNEHDYMSRYANTNLSWDFNDKTTTLNLGASVSFDEVFPTGFNYNKYKTSQQYLIGVSQILDQNSVVKSNLTFGYHKGFLSDPYKLVFFDGGGLQADTRPGSRFQWSWLTQYVRYFKNANDAALHLDYRFYTDDWDINAHTFEASWHQPIVDDWMIIPRFRYYSQDRARFYAPYFGADNGADVFSSDYRLAGFGAISGGVKLTKELLQIGKVTSLKFQAAIDYYDRKSSYQLGGDNGGSFDDFSYYLVTASFNLRF
ncbi:MAG: DUF3570 domain-containing protein [Gammaproteobacteria bacterium]